MSRFPLLLLLMFTAFYGYSQHVNRDMFTGKWRLIHIQELERENDYFIHDKKTSADTGYRGLALQHIDEKHILVDHKTGPHSYTYHLKEKTNQHAQIKLSGKHHLGTVFIHYLDADSMVLRHFYIDSARQPQAYYNCYLRTDDKYKTFSVLKKHIMQTWWFCGSYADAFEKDSLAFTNENSSQPCTTNHCQQTSFDFNRDEYGLELDMLTRSYCEGETDKTVSGTSYHWKLNPDNTLSIMHDQQETVYQPIIRNKNTLVLSKKQ